MRRLSPAGRTLRSQEEDDLREEDLFDTSSDEEEAKGKRKDTSPPAEVTKDNLSRAEAERRALNLVTNGGWERSGASGLLRKSSTPVGMEQGTRRGPDEDDGVD